VIQLFDAKSETLKFHNSFVGLYGDLTTEREKMWNDCYSGYALADFLYGKVPASVAMPLSEWRQSFNHIIQSFRLSGTIESYITMMEGLFGSEVVTTFVIPAPAELEVTIDISETSGVEKNNWVTNNAIDMVDDSGNNLVFCRVLGTIDEAALTAILQATTPVGIKVTFTIVTS
jgi:hypothetical protein